MKLLLDENLPHALRHALSPHEAFTTTYQGWDGIKNGKLLALAAANGFDALLTLDDGIAYQQNVTTLPLAVVIVSSRTGRKQDILALAPAILAALAAFKPKQIIRVPQPTA